MKKKIFNKNLEALRGFAALMVVLGHTIQLSFVFNGEYEFIRRAFNYMFPTHTMVLVFFLLSGYVIGLNYANQIHFDIKLYLRKRLVRLYPIYLISILITVLFFKNDLEKIIGHLLFLQILLVDVFKENTPLWSLNFEMLFYLAVIPIIYFKVKVHKILIVLSSILVFSVFIGHFNSLLESYVFGFIFWLLGFWISKFNSSINTVSSNKVLASFLLALSIDYINLFSSIFNKLNLPSALNDITVLPYCFFLILVSSGSYPKWLIKFIFVLVYGSSFSQLLYLIIKGVYFETDIYIIPSIFLILSFIIWSLKNVQFEISKLAFVGSISYALYVIHFPIIYILGLIKFTKGNNFTFIVGAIIIIFSSLFIAWLLERKAQPYFKKMLLVYK